MVRRGSGLRSESRTGAGRHFRPCIMGILQFLGGFSVGFDMGNNSQQGWERAGNCDYGETEKIVRCRIFPILKVE